MGALQKFDPFNDLWNWPDEVGRLFWNLGHRSEEGNRNFNFVPVIDVAENNEAMTVTAELPGLKKDDIKIKVRDGVLTLSGEKKFEKEEKDKDNYYRLERSYGSFARSLTLPNTVDAANIRAVMKDGVLELSIPKKPEAKEKEIDVNVD
jgi:HSP20 family protein